MKDASKTPSQDRLAIRAEKSNKLAEIAKRPTTPWLLGKLAALESWRQRPTSLQERLARSSDNMRARSQEMDDMAGERAGERLQAVIGKYRRLKAGEPAVVPQSDEVTKHAYHEEVAAIDEHSKQEPQPPEAPEQQ